MEIDAAIDIAVRQNHELTELSKTVFNSDKVNIAIGTILSLAANCETHGEVIQELNEHCDAFLSVLHLIFALGFQTGRIYAQTEKKEVVQ